MKMVSDNHMSIHFPYKSSSGVLGIMCFPLRPMLVIISTNFILCVFLSDVDECFNIPCQNGGKCININGDYRCDCNHGNSGKNCHLGKYTQAPYAFQNVE